MKVRDIIKLLEADGWRLKAQRGSHRQFVHPVKKGKATVAGKDNYEPPIGTAKSIFRQAGLPFPKKDTR